MGEDDESNSSNNSRILPMPESSSTSKTKNQHQRLKLQVFHDVLHRLQRYALDVNVERSEVVLTHMKLLSQAHQLPSYFLAFDLRLVQVNSTANRVIDDTVHSHSSTDEGSQGIVKNSSLGVGPSLHPPPTFGSSQNPEVHGISSNPEDQDSFINNCTSSSSRAMHEITFSTIDKPKLLVQLTSLLSEMSLNILEAHAFSTTDGYSLDVFVVDGWPHEETEALKSLLEKEIQNMKQPQAQYISPARAGMKHQGTILHKNVKEVDRNDDVDIDQSLLKIGCKVSSGSHGDLYKGTYCGQEVAVKFLKPERVSADVVKEFFQEVNIMRKIQHKNVVRFIGACTKHPNLFLLTEFMPKGNLYDFMHKRKRVLEFQLLLRAAIDISSGMDYLHQNNIIHRDLKSANLLMGENGVVKVADFGIARVQLQPGVMTAETGTYRWMAPEVISHKPYDHKADVFSFGIVLWELLTGKLPYSNWSPLQAAVGVVQKGVRPAIPNDTNPKIAALLRRCWHQDPNLRPEFSEIIKILEGICKEMKDVKEEPDSCRD
ncbi:serine/threonine-protein kinase STY46-like isoform X2 [Silene latifolia]|uniref:serine/threonine-protein kinase STY46-like isoform X2 n=1 Tax=Silene latifolia TaxID=37657 RepID=UPI003D77BD8E